MLEWGKKRYQWILSFVVGIGILITIAGVLFNQPVRQTDEVTLFGETLKMVNGDRIYQDINVLVTPLFFYLGWIIFKIFSANYLVYRCFGVAIFGILFLAINQLLKSFKIEGKYRIVVLLFLILFLKNVINVGANYNILAIAVSIYAIYYEIKNLEKKDTKFFIIQGILIFLIFMIKQTIGVYQFCAFVICELIQSKNKKETLKHGFLTIGTIVGAFFLFSMFLLMQGSLDEFVDYVFLGMLDFQENQSIETYLILWSIGNLVFYLVQWKRRKVNEAQEILFIYAMVMLLIGYPILCDFHSRMAMIYSVLSFSVLLFYLKEELSIGSEVIEKGITIVFWLAMLVGGVKNLYLWKMNNIYEKESHYYGAIYSESFQAKIEEIIGYMEKSDKRVVIVSPEASFYAIELDINNGVLDLPVRGNCGLHGSQKIIEKIDNLGDAKVIMTDYMYFQEYAEVHEYIATNFTRVDTVMEVYGVYERRD